MTDTYEHLEELPDQDEIRDQESVDAAFAGTLPQSDRGPEAMAIVAERRELIAAATQLAAALDRSNTPATKTIAVASQAIFRTLIVEVNDGNVKLCSDHPQRSNVKIGIYLLGAGNAYPQVSPYQIGIIPTSVSPQGSAVPLPAAATPATITYTEIRTTSELWLRLTDDSTQAVAVCVVEEFVS